MSWMYDSASGVLSEYSTYVATGYSGAKPNGWNNPDAESIPNVGPLPRGTYTFTELIPHDGKLGPDVLVITPCPGTNVFGRSDFRMHGNSKDNNASHGCLIFDPVTRLRVWNSGDHDLTVI